MCRAVCAQQPRSSFFFFSSRRRHTRCLSDWSSDVCSSDLSFAVITVVGGRGDRDHDLDAYRGLGRRQPVLALAFAVLLLGQTGIPFTTGFLAKLYVVSAAVRAHSYALAIIAMLSATIAAAFYLRLIFLMYGVKLPLGTGSDDGALSLDRKSTRLNSSH